LIAVKAAKKCPKRSTSLVLNQAGRPGVNGLNGANGSAGSAGAQGPVGPATGAAGGALAGTYRLLHERLRERDRFAERRRVPRWLSIPGRAARPLTRRAAGV
jgi:hypothetical protein